MSEESSLSDIKRTHSTLYERAIADMPLLAGSGSEAKRESFRQQVDALMQQIEKVSTTALSSEDYSWLSDAALQWQVAYTSLFNKPMSVNIKMPPQGTLPSMPRCETLSESEIRALIAMISEIRAHFRIKLEGRFSNEDEMQMDWRFAEAFFVSEVLDGRINFVSRIGSHSYRYLENQWLKYIKTLRAYFNWEKRGFQVDPSSQWEDYFEACEHLREMLVNPGIKAEPVEFGPVKRYLEERFLTQDGRIDTAQNPAVNMLIARKADRIWGTTGQTDEITNWQNAEIYVQMFYESVIPAVTQDDPEIKREKTLTVLKAFQFSKVPENGYRVINCFEVALAIYFLDADIIGELWREAQDKPLPDSHVKSVVFVQWPRAFHVPKECDSLFTYEKDRIIFDGVMTHEQKRALLAQVQRPELAEAVEKLFKQSRLIHRETTF